MTLMVHAILYVSRCRLPPAKAEAAVAEIVDRSIRWNRRVGITGALIFTEQHFAQFIEGPEPEVLALMARLRRDPRHTDIDIQREGRRRGRLFEDWSLAYSGPALFLGPHILPLVRPLAPERRDALSEDLILLMQGFASPMGG